jgi:hypothetical protein
MDYEYQEKKKEIYYMKYIAFKIYVLCIRFHKIFFVCECQLSIYKKYVFSVRKFYWIFVDFQRYRR